ncbi:MAG TPA: AraC family transcriptional regulator [Kofleriaceae bacterium]
MAAAVGFEACTVEPFSGAFAITGDVRHRQFPLRVTDSLAIVLNQGPAQTIIADGKQVVVPSNAAIFRPPNAIWTIPSGEFGFACINIESRLLPRGTRFHTFTWRPATMLPVLPVIDQLRTGSSDHAIAGVVENLFSIGLARSGERFAGEPNTARRAREYLEANFAENPTLDEIGHAAGINRFALVRLFRRVYGITPHAFQIRLQLRRAQRMLMDGEDLGSVAARVGFADPSHLTRHFRRVHGVTPGAYRNLQFRSTDRARGAVRMDHGIRIRPDRHE